MWNRTWQTVTLAALASLALAQPISSGQHEHSTELRGARLVVSDAHTNTLHILDVDSSQVIGTFTVPGPIGRLAVTESGQHAIASHPEANRISIIHSGLTSEDHGSHAHLIQGAPYVLATMNVGRQPTQVVPAGSRVLVSNSTDGTIAILDETLFGLSLNYELLETSTSGHSVPMMIDDFVLAGYGSSGSIDIFDQTNNLLDSREGCHELHGAIQVGTTGVFSCADGVLLAELHDDHFHWTHVTPVAHVPDTTTGPDAARVDTFYGHVESLAIGRFGEGLALIDAEAGAITVLELPSSPLDAAITGNLVVALGADGGVSLLEVADGTAELQFTLEEVVSTGTQYGNPAIAALGDDVFISDPSGGRVVVLHIDNGTLELAGSIEVPGNPSAIGVLMLAGNFDWH